MARRRKTYTKEFKEEAVRLVERGDRSACEIAESLGVSSSLLSRWVRSKASEGNDAFRGRGRRTQLDEENWQLRQQVKRLEQELKFLKKVSRYFAQDPQ